MLIRTQPIDLRVAWHRLITQQIGGMRMNPEQVRRFNAASAPDRFRHFLISGVTALVLFNLFLLRLGFGAEFIGVLTGSGQLAWALCALPAGLYVRRFGLRIGLMTGALAQAVSITAMLSVEALPQDNWLELESGGLSHWP